MAADLDQIRTTCPYCGVGCGVEADADESTSTVRIIGDAQHPANAGKLCVKGSALGETLGETHRLASPSVDGQRATWDSASQAVADRLRQTVDRYGPDSVAFYLSGQLLTEDYYVANKLMKGFIGSANVDTNSRLCMASAVAAHVRAFGEDVVPCRYEDLDRADLIVLVGHNAAWTHPVIHQRISRRRQAGARVIAIDPRATATTREADLHLAIAPSGDLALFELLFESLRAAGHARSGWSADNVDGVADWRPSLPTPDDSLASTGLSKAEVEDFIDTFSRTERVVTVFSQGVNQSEIGTDTANAIINCHLVTGRIGKPGMGPFSMTGQPNAMGGREVGGLANQLAAHRGFDAESVDAVRRFWDAPNIATRPGLKAVELFDAIHRGQVRFVWIMATNPAVSLPNAGRVREALRRCETVVVSDCHQGTDTARYADIVLPAQGWGEKDGTVTNSERCISRQRRFLPAFGEARADWAIVCDVAQRLGFTRGFAFHSAADVFAEHARLSGFENSGSRQFDISPLANADYDAMAPTVWPLNLGSDQNLDQRPFASGGFPTPNGRARIVAAAERRLERSETADTLTVNSGRSRDQWHTMTRTAEAPRLNQHSPWPEVALARTTAALHQLREGDLVRLISAETATVGDRDAVVLPVRFDDGLRTGEAFVPIHWNDEFASSAVVSRLYGDRRDPHSSQPASKSARVSVARVEVGAWSRCIALDASAVRLEDSDVWFHARLSRGRLTDLASADTNRFQSLAAHFDQRYPNAERLTETTACTERCLWIDGGQVVAAIAAAPTRAELPAVALFDAWLSETDAHWTTLSGHSMGDIGALVCSCFEVRAPAISEAIEDGCDSIEALGDRLKCGTNCGSCKPELGALIDAYDAEQARQAICRRVG